MGLQGDIYNRLEQCEELCNEDVSAIFNVTRQHANRCLKKLEKSVTNVTSQYRQVSKRSVLYSVKYYKIK